MFYYLNEYGDFVFYALVMFAICTLVLGVSYLITIKNPYNEKNTGYECGFDPFSDAREPFYVKFYLISILFIIFDVEVVFFFSMGNKFKAIIFFWVLHYVYFYINFINRFCVRMEKRFIRLGLIDYITK